MEIKDVTRKYEKKTERLNLKTTKNDSKWLRENNISPQKIFDLAIAELRTKKK